MRIGAFAVGLSPTLHRIATGALKHFVDINAIWFCRVEAKYLRAQFRRQLCVAMLLSQLL